MDGNTCVALNKTTTNNKKKQNNGVMVKYLVNLQGNAASNLCITLEIDPPR